MNHNIAELPLLQRRPAGVTWVVACTVGVSRLWRLPRAVGDPNYSFIGCHAIRPLRRNAVRISTASFLAAED